MVLKSKKFFIFEISLAFVSNFSHSFNKLLMLPSLYCIIVLFLLLLITSINCCKRPRQVRLKYIITFSLININFSISLFIFSYCFFSSLYFVSGLKPSKFNLIKFNLLFIIESLKLIFFCVKDSSNFKNFSNVSFLIFPSKSPIISCNNLIILS